MRGTDKLRPLGSAGHAQRAFSLVEMIVAILIMSIIAIGVVQFIFDSSQGYLKASNRNQLSSAGRVAVDRIAFELRNALPNSIRITSAYTAASSEVLAGDAYDGDQCLEFIPIRAATSYLNPPFPPWPPATSMQVIDFTPDQTGVTDVYGAIYPIRTAELYDPARQAPGAIGPVAEVSLVDDMNPSDGISELTLVSHRFNRRSRLRRFFLVDQPVSFCVKGRKLYRYSDYGFNAVQLRQVAINGACGGTCLPDATPGRVLISNELDNAGLTAFDQLAATRQRNAVVQLELNFSKAEENVLINHEVLLHNAP